MRYTLTLQTYRLLARCRLRWTAAKKRSGACSYPSSQRSPRWDPCVLGDSRILILRAFYNLDQIDRVWGWGHNALDALAATNMPAEQRVSSSINKVLNEWIENQPHHIVRFPQNCLWLCDSLKVAHQIISGRKMAAFTYNADPAPFSRSRLLFKNYISG